MLNLCRDEEYRPGTRAVLTAAYTGDGMEAATALRRIRSRRPDARPLPHQVEDLLRWRAGRQGA